MGLAGGGRLCSRGSRTHGVSQHRFCAVGAVGGESSVLPLVEAEAQRSYLEVTFGLNYEKGVG